MPKSLVDVLTNKQFLEILNGDKPVIVSDDNKLYLKRLSGPDIVNLDNKYGGNQCYSNYSRWVYMEELVKFCISTKRISSLLTELFNGIDLNKSNLVHNRENKKIAIETMIEAINSDLENQGFELVMDGTRVTIRDLDMVTVACDTSDELGSAKIRNTLDNCLEDLNCGRFADAIMRSSTLLEEALAEVLKQKGVSLENKKDLMSKFKTFLKVYEVELLGYDSDGRTVELTKSLENIVFQLGYYRNNFSSAHQHENELEPHVVRLAVNSTFTLVQFISDIHNRHNTENDRIS